MISCCEFYLIHLFLSGKRRFRNLSNMSPPRDPEVLWSDIASRILINVVAHPMEYAKVLIQVKLYLY